MTTSQKLAAIPIAGALLLGGGAIAGYAGLASAQTGSNNQGSATSTPGFFHRGSGMMGRMHGHGPGIVGTVSAVSGDTITVTGKNGTTYTVNASGASIDKLVKLSISDIKVGDTVGVQGQVSGSSVTANHIMDGIPPKPNQSTSTQTQ